MKDMSVKLKLYISFLIIVGTFLLIVGFFGVNPNNFLMLVFFVVLGLITESLPIKISNSIWISVSFGIYLAALLMFQSNVVLIVAYFSPLFCIHITEGKIMHIGNTEIYKRLFNASAQVICLAASVAAYNVVNGITNTRLFEYDILSIGLAIIAYSLFDLLIFSVLQSLLSGEKLHRILFSDFHLIVNVAAISPLGIFIAIIYQQFSFIAVIIFFGPLLVARYSFKLYVDMKSMYSETISALSNAVDAKDKYTNGHAHRVAEYAYEIGKNMGYSENRLDKIKTAAILHDIGKIGIKDVILNKPGKLEDFEYYEIQQHPSIGFNILSDVHDLSTVANIVKYHHERFGGGGYPEGISGDNVPIESYIIAVADAFDAMTSDRPYRKALLRDKAIGIIRDEAGCQFHPQVVEAFLKYVDANDEAGEMAHVH